MESNVNRFLDILNYPLINRCPELGLLIDRSSIKELQEIFPTLVRSMFGVQNNNQPWGWGIRTITKEGNPYEFDVLYNFLIPLGPMFRICYRLLNDSFKFDVMIEQLPSKFSQMLLSGRHPVFYNEMLSVDPFRRTLSLNAFDYFILHFVIHGLAPLHKMHPAALNIHTEKWKTIYFFLTADYLCSFLPSHHDSVVMPTNINNCIKFSAPLTVQTLPAKSPIYLSLSALSHTQVISNIRSPESPREHTWRTETVMYLFIDVWLRFDVLDNHDLPSSEFVRVVRILVKQLHAFGNSAEFDTTPMSSLRKVAQQMMNQQIHSFLNKLMSRWPLDSSFSVVLELWLSYIQPWRYTFERTNSSNTEIPISSKFEKFIVENIIVYTQIFGQLIERFERLDFSSLRNVIIVSRLLKVFSQPRLLNIIADAEQQHSQTLSNHSSPRKTFDLSKGSPSANYFESSTFVDDRYIFMFGPDMTNKLQSLVQKLVIAKLATENQITQFDREMQQSNSGFINTIKNIFVNDFDPVQQHMIADLKRIPSLIETCLNTIVSLNNGIDVPDTVTSTNANFQTNDSNLLDAMNNSSRLDSILNTTVSPQFMRRNINCLKYTGDPELMPIQSNECKFLVRVFHHVSVKLNEIYEEEICELWNRADLIGRISRQILLPPQTIGNFDKCQGLSYLVEEDVGPRVSLRFLATYRSIIVLVIALLLGKYFFNATPLGLILLIVISMLYFLISSFIRES